MTKTKYLVLLLLLLIVGVIYLNKPPILTALANTLDWREVSVQRAVVNVFKTDEKSKVNVMENEATDAHIMLALADIDAAETDAPSGIVLDAKNSASVDEAFDELLIEQAAALEQDIMATKDKRVKQSSSGDAIRVLLMPRRETTIASKQSGRINRLKAGLGQSFKRGMTLVSFECDEAYARVAIAKATLSAAIEEHEAKIKMQGLDQASDIEVALAAAAVNKGRAELKLQRVSANECNIHAPWQGRIAKVHVHNNMTVQAGEPLLDLVDAGPLKIRLNIPSALLQQIKVGETFDVAIDETGKTYAAKISAINSRIDAVSQTIEVEALMTAVHRELLAGMSGTADLSNIAM